MSFPDCIVLDHLEVGYHRSAGSISVLSGLDATLRGGSLTALLGGNGVGKSTLLRTLSGSLPPLSGTVQLMGRPLDAYTAGELSRTLSVVLTDRPDLTGMSVFDTVALGRSPYTGFFGALSREDRLQVDRSLRMLGLGDFHDRRMEMLSDGERQKVMIAKSLAQDTPVILLDEPTAFLDYSSKVEMMRLLLEMARSTGKAVLFSTHDVDLALQLSDGLWLLDPAPQRRHLVQGMPEDLAFSGRLGAYLSASGMDFDAHRGVLSMPRAGSLSPLGLKGSREYAEMLEHGLLRHGFRLAWPGERTAKQLETVCEASGGVMSFRLYEEGILKGSFDTLESLLTHLDRPEEAQQVTSSMSPRS